MKDREHEIEFVVRVRNYGGREQVERETRLQMMLAIHRTFGDSATVLTHDRRVLRFDSFAYDGEHTGHEQVIVEES